MQRIYTTSNVDMASFLAGKLVGGWIKPIVLDNTQKQVTIYEVHCFTSNSTDVIQSALYAMYTKFQ